MSRLKYRFNETGSVTYFAIALTCIFSIMLFAHYHFFHTTDTQKSTEYICQSELLKIQKYAAQNIQNLIELNKLVISTRITKKTALGMIAAGAATFNAALVAAGEKLLQASIKMEKIISTLQEKYLNQARMYMQIYPQSTLSKIKKELQKRKNTSALQTSFLPKNPAVKKRPSANGPPEYVLEYDFIHKQALHAFWKYRQSISDEGNMLWKKVNLKKSLSCSASIEIKDGKYLPVLIEDKF